MIRAMFFKRCLTSFETLHSCVITKHFYNGQSRVNVTFLAFWLLLCEGVGCKWPMELWRCVFVVLIWRVV
jgi:hypothetical protein